MMFDNMIFDFDGVILDSVDIKTEAFRILYSNESQSFQEYVINYHLEHGGISRIKKIAHFESLLGNSTNDKDERIAKKVLQFSQLNKNKIMEANFINGVFEFIKKNHKNSRMFICSGIPQDELEWIVKIKKLTKYFHGVYGSPRTKESIIQSILQEFDLIPDNVMFFGDSLTDYRAAINTGLSFTGIRNSRTLFPYGTSEIVSFQELL